MIFSAKLYRSGEISVLYRFNTTKYRTVQQPISMHNFAYELMKNKLSYMVNKSRLKTSKCPLEKEK